MIKEAGKARRCVAGYAISRGNRVVSSKAAARDHRDRRAVAPANSRRPNKRQPTILFGLGDPALEELSIVGE